MRSSASDVSRRPETRVGSNLVPPSGLMDLRECVVESAGSGSAAVMSCLPGADLHGAVAVAADGERGEHDAQVGVDRLALVVIDRPCREVVFGHPEQGLDLVEPAVGADHELGGDGGCRRGR